MFDLNLLVTSDHVIDANMLDRTWVEMPCNALAKEGSAELPLLAMGRGHVVDNGKDQVTVSFFLLMIGLGRTPCAGRGWCYIPFEVCGYSLDVGLLVVAMASSAGLVIVGWCEA